MAFTWRKVFDCKKWYGNIAEIAQLAKQAGYRYFNWNGRIYDIRDDGEIEETDLRTKDLN